jgi:hypothetical protein
MRRHTDVRSLSWHGTLLIYLQAINLFISSADQLYGPITTLRRDGCTLKKLPWTAFSLSDSDWTRVLDAKLILAVSKYLPATMLYDASA